jgi:hypothetical protein
MKYPGLIFRGALIAALAYFSYLLLLISLQYVPFSKDVAFLKIKATEVLLPYYIPFFKAHIFTSFFLLLAGFTQFSPFVRKKYRRVHRLMGWFYCTILLLFSAPSGLVLGFHANGGVLSQFTFLLLGFLWIYTTIQSLRYAFKKEWIKHKQFMIRSYALTLSAITLRLWKYIIVVLFHPPPMDVYRIIAWLGWVLNILIAEWIIFSFSTSVSEDILETKIT